MLHSPFCLANGVLPPLYLLRAFVESPQFSAPSGTKMQLGPSLYSVTCHLPACYVPLSASLGGACSREAS